MGYNDHHEAIDKPVARDSNIFESFLTTLDEKAMKSYEASIKTETLDLTGRDVNLRLIRIDAEIKRITELQEQLIRLKRITKRALLGVAGSEES